MRAVATISGCRLGDLDFLGVVFILVSLVNLRPRNYMFLVGEFYAPNPFGDNRRLGCGSANDCNTLSQPLDCLDRLPGYMSTENSTMARFKPKTL